MDGVCSDCSLCQVSKRLLVPPCSPRQTEWTMAVLDLTKGFLRAPATHLPESVHDAIMVLCGHLESICYSQHLSFDMSQ